MALNQNFTRAIEHKKQEADLLPRVSLRELGVRQILKAWSLLALHLAKSSHPMCLHSHPFVTEKEYICMYIYVYIYIDTHYT